MGVFHKAPPDRNFALTCSRRMHVQICTQLPAGQRLLATTAGGDSANFALSTVAIGLSYPSSRQACPSMRAGVGKQYDNRMNRVPKPSQ